MQPLIWLAQRLRIGSRERGAVSTIVAVLLGGGVVLGCAALSIDVGSLMWERRQVQNGADATAFALADICAGTPSRCTPAAATSAADGLAALNNANAHDNADGYDRVAYPASNGLCGSGAGTLPSCSAAISPALANCPAIAASLAGYPYVESHTATGTTSTAGLLPPFIAQAMGFGGETVRACARVVWGAPGPHTATVPFTFSVCQWAANTTSGASYYDAPQGAAPGYGGAAPSPAWPAASREIKLYLQQHPVTTPCTFNGHVAPGGFGYMSTSGTCAALVGDGNWVQVDTGISPPHVCDIGALRGKVVEIPIFDCTVRSGSLPTHDVAYYLTHGSNCNDGTGTNMWYHVVGWGTFYLAGYRVAGSDAAASLNPSVNAIPCGNPDRCISGWFVRAGLHDVPLGGPPGTGFGPYVIQGAG